MVSNARDAHGKIYGKFFTFGNFPIKKLSSFSDESFFLYEFDDCHFAGVAEAGSHLDDAGVAAVSVLVLGCDFFEQFCYGFFFIKIFQCLASCCEIASLAESDHAFSDLSGLFGTCERSDHATVLDEALHLVSEHGVAMI